MQVVYLGGDPKKHSESKERDREGRKVTRTCSNKQVTSEGTWDLVHTGDALGNSLLHT